MEESRASSDGLGGSGDGPFHRGFEAGAVSYPIGLAVYFLYLVLTVDVDTVLDMVGRDAITFGETLVGSYGSTFVAADILAFPGPPSIYWNALLSDPLRLVIPMAVLTGAAWHFARGGGFERQAEGSRHRFLAGIAAGHLTIFLITVFTVESRILSHGHVAWQAVVIGVVYPVVFGRLALWLAHRSARASSGTEEHHESPTRPVDGSSTVPAAADSSCPECGERAGRGTFCPHCGADL